MSNPYYKTKLIKQLIEMGGGFNPIRNVEVKENNFTYYIEFETEWFNEWLYDKLYHIKMLFNLDMKLKIIGNNVENDAFTICNVKLFLN